ncbi:notchless protein-like protein [Hibiscus syriacus]|uniref:Notchless protein-like protein n=1 Tax=Hibiscus syriacus TaxID=106335 RepID=A0A6A2XUP5_HIBSY|nr:notchless protein-like protein [Hibiscus syriacus]
MKGSEIPMKGSKKIQSQTQPKSENPLKPPFKPAKDDTKPHLQDPILRSDPNETEEAVLRLPPFHPLR